MITRGVYRDVLSDHDTRALIGASAASQLGDWLYNAALLGYIYTATGSAAWVGAATVVRLLPYVVFGPVGGMLADRHDRRSVLLAGDGLRLLMMLALAAAVAADGPVIIVIALTALASAAGTAEKPAAMALLPRQVGETRLGTANAATLARQREPRAGSSAVRAELMPQGSNRAQGIPVIIATMSSI